MIDIADHRARRFSCDDRVVVEDNRFNSTSNKKVELSIGSVHTVTGDGGSTIQIDGESFWWSSSRFVLSTAEKSEPGFFT